jgi:nucleoside-diphosphate-sugar epimerase
MMYMPDCIKAAVDLMESESAKIKYRMGYNVAGMSFSAGELVDEIRKRIPDFECEYKPDFRQRIADSWPRSLDDSLARREWGWRPDYDLPALTDGMIKELSSRLSKQR